MVLNRYSEIFSDQLVNKLKPLMIEFQAPISSLHLRFSGGVWALHDEYDSREDHPYKYGYGVLMHGAYHFIDIVTQLLSLNRLVFPDDIFIMSLTSFGAFPSDHVDRVSQKVRTDFDDQGKNLARTSPSTGIVYGETDIVTSFSVTNKSTGSVITLGTLAFEQTTPSVRHWKALPSIYNVNGRLTSVNVEARLGHLQSITVDYYDKPGSDAVLDPDNIESFAQITIKSNASLLEKHAYVQTKEFHHVHSSDSNRALLNAWLNGTETLSDITTHVLPMLLTQYLAQSAKKPGTTITFDLEC